MTRRVITRIGDIFSVNLGDSYKVYFQYICNDLTQLNSDVIRVFKNKYEKDSKINSEDLLMSDIDFHAHTMVNVGFKQNIFIKEGSFKVITSIKDIIFRNTEDYGKFIDDKPILVSNNWFTWRINDEQFKFVGALENKNREAEIGVIMPPFAIVDRIISGKFNFQYPLFE